MMVIRLLITDGQTVTGNGLCWPRSWILRLWVMETTGNVIKPVRRTRNSTPGRRGRENAPLRRPGVWLCHVHLPELWGDQAGGL
jgi:hypothetical protein